MSTNIDNHTTTTPRNPDTPYNFGPASTRDDIVFTSERPGGDPPAANVKVSMDAVQKQIDFFKAKGIRHVLILLDDHELDIYEPPGLITKYSENGLTVHRNPMGIAGSSENAKRILQKAMNRKEKMVAHCTHGMGRSGRIAAGWLVMQYGLTPSQATEEVLQTAREHGVERMGDVRALEQWLSK